MPPVPMPGAPLSLRPPERASEGPPSNPWRLDSPGTPARVQAAGEPEHSKFLKQKGPVNFQK